MGHGHAQLSSRRPRPRKGPKPHSYGAFVELEEGIDGMVHVSDMSWTRKINHPSEMVKKGDEVDAIVVEVDAENQRISLGMKQLTQDPWEDIDRLYRLGDVIKGKVARVAGYEPS